MTRVSESEGRLTREGDTPLATLAKGASVAMLGKFLGRGMHILGQLVVARFLGPASFGLYGTGWTVVTMGGVFATLGLDQAVVRFGSRYRRSDPPGFKATVLECIALAVGCGILIGLLAKTVFSKPELSLVFRLFSPAIGLFAGLRVAAAATVISQRMSYAVAAEDFTQPVANLALVAVLSLLGFGLVGAVSAGTFSFACGFAVAIALVIRLFPQILTDVGHAFLVPQLLRFALPASLAGIFIMYMSWIDRLMVALYRPVEEIGLYQAASQASLLFAIIQGAITAIAMPMIADLHDQNERQTLARVFRVSTKWSLYVSLPLFAVVWTQSQQLMTVIYGTRYSGAALSLLILSAGQLVNASTGAVGPLLVMTGGHVRWSILCGIMLALEIALSLVLVPTLHGPGAATAGAIALGGLNVLGVIEARRRLGLWAYDTRYLKGVLAAVLTFFALWLLDRLPLPLGPVRLATTAAVSVIVFVTTLRFIGLDSEDSEVLSRVRTRIVRSLG